MQLLLSDLGITTETDLFDQAELTRLVVNKKRRTWTFYFSFPKVLPYDVHQLFMSRLESRYATFADEVYARFSTTAGGSEQDYIDYWPRIVSELSQVSGAMRSYFGSVSPRFEQNKLMIPVRSAPEASYVDKELCQEVPDHGVLRLLRRAGARHVPVLREPDWPMGWPADPDAEPAPEPSD